MEVMAGLAFALQSTDLVYRGGDMSARHDNIDSTEANRVKNTIGARCICGFNFWLTDWRRGVRDKKSTVPTLEPVWKDMGVQLARMYYTTGLQVRAVHVPAYAIE